MNTTKAGRPIISRLYCVVSCLNKRGDTRVARRIVHVRKLASRPNCCMKLTDHLPWWCVINVINHRSFPFVEKKQNKKKTKSWNGLRRLDGSLYFETIYDHVCEVYICMYTYVLLDKLIHGTTLYDLYVGRPAIYIGCNSFTYLFLLYAAVRVVSQPVISTLWIVASLIKIQACGVWFKSFEGNAQFLSVDIILV